MTIAENVDIQRRLAINAERMGLRCKRSVGTFRWLRKAESLS